MKKLLGILKVFAACAAIGASCWGGIKVAVTLPESVEAVKRQADKNSLDIETVRLNAQGQKEILIRIDERGKNQEQLLKELKDEMRKR